MNKALMKVRARLKQYTCKNVHVKKSVSVLNNTCKNKTKIERYLAAIKIPCLF